jgi:hypothetical protein
MQGGIMGKMKRIRAEALREQRQAFIEKFGREPGPDDPVIFDPDADVPVPLSEEKVRAAMLEAMQAAEIPLHLIYAYAKTGFIVGQEGYRNMSLADRAVYNAALKEYFAMGEERKRH